MIDEQEFTDLLKDAVSRRSQYASSNPRYQDNMNKLMADKPEPVTESPTAGDYGRLVMGGAGSAVEGVGYTLESLGADTVGGFLRDAGERASQYWQEGLTDAAKREMEREFVTFDEEGKPQLGDATWSTVGLATASSLMGTAAGMGLGLGLAKGFMLVPKVGKTVAGILGYGAGEAGIASGSAGAETERVVRNMSIDDLSKHPEYQAAFEATGNADEARETVAKAAGGDAQALTALTTFVLSAPAGAAMGRLAGNIPHSTTRPRAIATGAITEATQEFGQSGAEQVSQNIAIQRHADESQPLSEGVLNKAVGGAAAGGLMGGAFGTAAPLEQTTKQKNADREAGDIAAKKAAKKADLENALNLATQQLSEKRAEIAQAMKNKASPEQKQKLNNELDALKRSRSDLNIRLAGFDNDFGMEEDVKSPENTITSLSPQGDFSDVPTDAELAALEEDAKLSQREQIEGEPDGKIKVMPDGTKVDTSTGMVVEDGIEAQRNAAWDAQDDEAISATLDPEIDHGEATPWESATAYMVGTALGNDVPLDTIVEIVTTHEGNDADIRQRLTEEIENVRSAKTTGQAGTEGRSDAGSEGLREEAERQETPSQSAEQGLGDYSDDEIDLYFDGLSDEDIRAQREAALAEQLFEQAEAERLAAGQEEDVKADEIGITEQAEPAPDLPTFNPADKELVEKESDVEPVPVEPASIEAEKSESAETGMPVSEAITQQVERPEQQDPVEGKKSYAEGNISSTPDIVEITTKKGKVLKGFIRPDLTLDQAKEIDKYSWKPAGYDGPFIREQHIDALNERFPLSQGKQADVAPDIKPKSKGELLKEKIKAKKEAEKPSSPLDTTAPTHIDTATSQKITITDNRGKDGAVFSFPDGSLQSRNYDETSEIQPSIDDTEQERLSYLERQREYRAKKKEQDKEKVDKGDGTGKAFADDDAALDIERYEQEEKKREHHAKEIAENINDDSTPTIYKNTYGTLFYTINRAANGDKKYQVTVWDNKGPISDSKHNTAEEIIQHYGYGSEFVQKGTEEELNKLVAKTEPEKPKTKGELLKEKINKQKAEQQKERVDTKKAAKEVSEGKQTDKPIDDYGEKIAGAKKDLAASLQREFSDNDLAALPLSKIWPKSDIEGIEDIEVAAFVTAARQEIPAKPRVKHKIHRWVEKVKAMRELAEKVVSGKFSYDYIVSKMPVALDGFKNRVHLMTLVDREYWNHIGRVNTYPDAYRYEDDGSKTSTPSVYVEIDGSNKIFKGKSIESVLDDIKAKLSESDGVGADRKLQFEIRGHKGRYFINKKGDPEYRELKEFTDLAEARAYIKENYDELASLWEAVKERYNVRKTDVRGKSNRERTGSDHRNGKDISPEEFAGTFGFRGIQFGNWVKQGKAGKDRQGMLNQAYDALMDLSVIVGVPPKALSLNGELGLAFGARGSGSAMAHYEPGQVVINLTKTKGAGTLAHEWFHALDNYFSKKRGDKGSVVRDENYITHKPEPMYVHKTKLSKPHTKAELERYRKKSNNAKYYAEENWHKDPNHPEGVRPEVEEKFARLVDALNDSPMRQRAAAIDQGKSDGYWSRTLERAARSFENYVITKMKDDGYHNDFLANVTGPDGFARDKGRYPYLLDSEMEPIASAFDDLFATIEYRETDKGVELHEPESDYERKASKIRRDNIPAEQGRLDLFTSPTLSVEQRIQQAVDNASTLVKAEEKGTIRTGIARVKTLEDAAHILAPVRRNAQEVFYALVMDGKGNPLAVIDHAKGTIDGASVYPGVFAGAVAQIPGAKDVVIAHNHPSGIPDPSAADYRITEKIKDVLTNLGFDVKGHVVFGSGRTASTFTNDSDMKKIIIKAAVRSKGSIPITHRVIRKRKAAGSAVESPSAARDMVEGIKADNAVILMNNQNQPVAVVDMSPQEMATLRGSGNAKRLAMAVSSTNTNALIIKTASGSVEDAAIKNMATFASKMDIRLLDYMFKVGESWSSLAEVGGMPSPSKVLFSRNNPNASATRNRPISKVQADKVIARIVKGFPRKIEAIVVDGFANLPVEVQDRANAEGANNQIRGVFHKGDIYLVRDQLNSEAEVEEVFFHEAYGHYGLRGLFGKDVVKALNTLFIAIGGDKGIKTFADKYGISLTDYVVGAKKLQDGGKITQEQRDALIMEELLAHLAQDQKPSIAKRAKELLGAIRAWLRDKGFMNLAKQNDADLMFLLKRARQAAQNGGKAPGGTRFMVEQSNPNKLPMDHASRMQRAKDMGFDVDSPATSSGRKISEITAGDLPGGGDNRFQGVFATWGDKSEHGGGEFDTTFVFRRPIAGSGDRDLDYDKSMSTLKREYPDLPDDKLDLLYEMSAGDKNVFDFDINPLEDEGFTDLGEASWEGQRLRGRIANDQGFDAINMDDEHGVSVLIPAGSHARSIEAAFDPSESDSSNIMFSKAKPEPSKDINDTKITDAVKDSFDNGGSFVKQEVFGLLTLRQTAEVIKGIIPSIINDYVPYVNLMDTVKNQVKNQAGKIAEYRRKQLSIKDNDVLSAFQHDSTIAGIDSSVMYQEVVNIEEAHQQIKVKMQRMRDISADKKTALIKDVKKLKTQIGLEVNRQRAREALKERWDKLSDVQQEIYIKERDFHVEVSARTEEALIERIKDAEGTMGDKKDLIALLRDEFESARVQAPYFPLARFGDFWVHGKDKDGEPFFDMFEGSGAQKAFIEQVQADGGEILGAGKNFEQASQQEGIGTEFMIKVEGMLKELGSDSRVLQIRDNIYQLYLQSLPELSARKNFIHRSKIKGFHKDHLRAFAHKAQRDANGLGRLKYAHKMSKVLLDAKTAVDMASSTSQMNKTVKKIRDLEKYRDEVLDMTDKEFNARTKELSKHKQDSETDNQEWEEWLRFRRLRDNLKGEDDQNATISKWIDDENVKLETARKVKGEDAIEMASNALRELNKAHDVMMNPNTHWLAQSLSTLGFAWYLGLSPAAAAVNLTQTAAVALPVMASKFGWGDSSKQLSKATKEFFAGGLSLKNNLATDNERKAFQRWYDEGLFTDTLSHDLAGYGEGGISTGSLQNKFANMTSYMFHHAERANREITTLAAYRAAISKGRSHDAAMKLAENVTWDSHFDYSAGNRARFMRGNFARVITQFKQYSQNMTYLYMRAWHQSFKGASATEQKEARRMLRGLLAMQFAFTGALGMPMASTVIAFAQMLQDIGGDDDDPKDLEAEARQWLADAYGKKAGMVISKGAIDAYTPLSVHGRLTLSDLWLRTSDRDLEGRAEAYDWMKAILGPQAAIVEGMFIAKDLIKDGHYYRAMENAMPKFIKDPLKAGRYLSEDAKTMRGYDMKEMTAGEIVGKLIGFSSSQLSDMYDQNNAVIKLDKKLNERRRKLLDGIIQAIDSGDTERAGNVRKEIREWNKKNPSRRITGKTIRQSRRGRARTARNMQGGMLVQKRSRGLADHFDFAQ